MSSRLSFALAFALVVATGCPAKSGGGADGGSNGGEATDGGSADGGTSDGRCHSDDDCAATKYCELASGVCLDAKACASNDDCYSDDPSDYCAFGRCFCDPNRNGGECRPRFKLCDACTSDLECGSDPFTYLDYTATCVAEGATHICLPLKANGCPPGYVATTDANCQPAGGSCGAARSCTTSDDCDPGSDTPECDTRRGFCVAPCVFDYRQGTSDCAPGEVCHVDPRLLDPSNPNFGGGECGAPCDAATDPYVCPTSDDAKSEACVEDGASSLSPRPKRCRPPAPACLRDEDCPPDAATNSNGWCDRATLTCKTTCRTSDDCRTGSTCVDGVCTGNTCLDEGGANLACALGQFCCGEQSSPDCPDGVDQGSCYDAPNPPWCASCSGSADTPPGSARPQPSKCVSFDDPHSGAPRKIEWHSCDPSKPAQCPRSWQCVSVLQWCDPAAGDCGANGSCENVSDLGSLGTNYMACGCDGGHTCPAPSTCNAQTHLCEANWCDMRYCLAAPNGG